MWMWERYDTGKTHEYDLRGSLRTSWPGHRTEILDRYDSHANYQLIPKKTGAARGAAGLAHYPNNVTLVDLLTTVILIFDRSKYVKTRPSP